MSWIIEDTRQKAEKHNTKHQYFESASTNIIRCKLPFGDYSKPPRVAIDTKEDMDEICGNICGKAHTRFVNECKAAQSAGCQLIILVENECDIAAIDDVHNWINPRVVYSPNCPQGEQLERAMKTMQERYGVLFLFCKPEDSGQRILELLEAYDERNKSE